MTLRERLRLLMEKNDLTAKTLAAKAGISVNTLNMYLGYREAIPAADVAVRLARALGVTVEYLVEGAQRTARARNRDLDFVSDSRAGKKAQPNLSAFDLIMEEIKKTPKESLPGLLELVIKFNSEHKGAPKDSSSRQGE